jgi:hypothetical protein
LVYFSNHLKKKAKNFFYNFVRIEPEVRDIKKTPSGRIEKSVKEFFTQEGVYATSLYNIVL